MKFSESPIITFVRGITLLATLIAVPGIAIFWNHLPKDFAKESTPKPNQQKIEKAQLFRTDSDKPTESVSAFVPESVSLPLPDAQIKPAVLSPAPQVDSDAAIRQVAWEQPTETPQNFEVLELRLKALGATYYQLQKWGNRGELFRFSCFVTPSEPYSYTKQFQAIGADAVTVMRSVIADIEQWKNAQ